MKPLPEEQRRFAVEVVARLREAGFVAYWAGGCVRDELLGRTPKDYDVATSARPEQIRDLFGHRRTLAIGAAFGVIAVLGPREAGTVEVTTFRRDAEYRDGRRPEGVTFTDAEEDARRRDFTMNALFFDPPTATIVDYVGGQDDIRRRIVRAVGDAAKRFDEDKLRVLRAVRMAAVFGFTLDEATRDAIVATARQVTVVSPERIAQELRGMLGVRGQSTAARMLVELHLADVILPELTPLTSRSPAEGGGRTYLELTLATLHELECRAPLPFPVALAALLWDVGRGEEGGDAAERGAKLVQTIGRRLRLSNDERDGAAWLVGHQESLVGAAQKPWSQIQPVLARDGGADLVTLIEARSMVLGRPPDDVTFCRERLAWPAEALNPPPLVSGNDLIRAGHRPGKEMSLLLDRVRAAQLDGVVRTAEEAIAWLK